MIHETAIVSKNAKIGKNTKIGPFCIISDDVVIGDSCDLANGVVIDNGARISDNVKIFSYASISTAPQDLKYAGEKTEVYIGENTVIREFATINRATTHSWKTIVGKNCLIMTYCHVAHDCIVGDNVIISNATQLGGHVTIEDWVTLGGVTKIHQFCTVGKHSMVGADVKIVKDVPPFTLIGRSPAQVEGINKVGLKRRGFSEQTIKQIDKFYFDLIFSGKTSREVLDMYASNSNSEILDCINFISESKRGIHR